MTEAQRPEYKIDLHNFAGPMDLLLYLIRKEEVDIYDIPIGRILDQYLAYLELIKAVDLDEAGDFLVMASTLMVIKSKMLLPVEEVDLAEELDPRYELVQQLLEYKNTKTHSRLLEQSAVRRSRRVGRPESARPEPRVEEDRTLDELQIWDLFQFFSKVMSETRIDVKQERVIEGRVVPVRDFAARIERRILEGGPLFLSELVRAGQPRSEILGFFLAVLLLVKTQAIAIMQSGTFGDIRLVPKELGRDDVEQAIELDDDFRD
ncbi:MAG: segregation/condensation protein A [Planctomycetes bacterium]|nr:segregation/condensation protein A [Planctomycetota bacterium]